MEKPNSNISTWILLMAVVLILIGLYGSIRTGINLAFFEKYPQSGVLGLNFSGVPYYPQREEDCNYPISYQEMPGENLSDEQKKERADQDKRNCLQGVVDARESAKVNDISQSLLFLFLGAGLLISKKILKF